MWKRYSLSSHPLWTIYGYSSPSDASINHFRPAPPAVDESQTVDEALKPLEEVVGLSRGMIASLMWNKGGCGQLKALGLLLMGECNLQIAS